MAAVARKYQKMVSITFYLREHFYFVLPLVDGAAASRRGGRYLSGQKISFAGAGRGQSSDYTHYSSSAVHRTLNRYLHTEPSISEDDPGNPVISANYALPLL